MARATNPIAGDAGKVFVRDVELDLTPVTTADSATWVMSDTGGTTVASGTLSYVAALMVDDLTDHAAWEADLTWPDPQDVLMTLNITKSGAQRTWRFRVTVRPNLL